MSDVEDNPDQETDDLVERAITGDPEAMACLYRLYENQMIATVHDRMGRTLHGLMESVDLVQSVWGDVLDDMRKFEHRGPGSFSRWLNTCLINKIQAKGRYFSAGKRTPEKEKRFRVDENHASGVIPPPASDRTPSEVVMSREESDQFEGLLDRFPPIQRQVLVLRMRDEAGYEEIGRIIGKSADAARKLYGRALRKLVSLLDEMGLAE